MSCIKFVIIFVFTIVFQSSISAQEWFSYQSQQQINDLVERGNEFFMATDAGLVVMNKTTLEKTFFNKSNSKLTDNHIETIAQAANGDIWIGTYDVSFAKFDGADFQEITPLEGDFNPNTIKLYDLKVASNGDLWVATSQGVFQKQEENWLKYDESVLGASFFEAWDIEINAEGVVFVASNTVHKFEDGVWSDLLEENEIEAYLGAELFFSESGDLFLAGDLDKIGRFDGQTWQEYNIEGMTGNGSEVIRFTEDLEGNVYFNTVQDGVFKLEGDAWLPLQDTQIEAFGNRTDFFYVDDRGNHWLNHNIHLTVNENGNIRSTTISPYTIEYNGIKDLHKGKNGSMYFMNFFNEHISVVDANGNWSFLQLPYSDFPFEWFVDILVMADDDIWLSSNQGLYHYNGNEWNLGELGAGSFFATDSQGKIYLRSSNSLYIMDEDIILEYNSDNSPLLNTWISGHGVDAYNNLWIAVSEENRILKMTPDGMWTTYEAEEHPAIKKPVGDFHFDVNGNVWIADDVVGAMRFDGATWSNPFEGNVDQVENYQAHVIQSDASGKMYFSHQYGVTTWLDGVWEDLLIEDVPNKFSSASSYLQFDDQGALWWASSRYGVFAYAAENPTSIHTNLTSTLDFSMYPTPTPDYITLDFTLEESTNAQAFVYNQLGQIQTRLNLGQLPASTFKRRIDLTELPSGLYTIQLWLDGAKSFAKKIIVH